MSISCIAPVAAAEQKQRETGLEGRYGHLHTYYVEVVAICTRCERVRLCGDDVRWSVAAVSVCR